MDKLVHKLNEEMKCWVGDWVFNSDISSDKLLARYSYEYCIKKEITDYFECNVISDELEQFLLDRDDTLEFFNKEFQILYHLFSYPNRIFSKNELVELICNNEQIISENTIRTYINTLRRKTEKIVELDIVT